MTLNTPASAGKEIRCTLQEVALSSASRDNSTCKLQCILFLKLGSHYYKEPPAPTGWGSTRYLQQFKGVKYEKKYGTEFLGTFWLVLGGCGSTVLADAFPNVDIGLLGVVLAFDLTAKDRDQNKI